MATGHLNPGYNPIIGNLKRAKSAPVHVDRFDLDEIRQNARQMWSDVDCNRTSYADHYKDRAQGSRVMSNNRPTSPSRKHNPHPPLVFLTTRLHHCPGYHNPDATLGKPAYRVDASLSPTQNQERAAMRSKYIGRPSTAAVQQYNRHEELDVIEDPLERQGTEAVLRIMDDRNKERVLDSLRQEQEMQSNELYSYREFQKPRSPDIVPSLYRYGKTSGAEEFYKYANLHYQKRGQLLHPKERLDIIAQRFRDIEKTRKCNYVHTDKRGDYLMHPEWPPSIPHHRLNGLSSLDIPYYPGRR